MTTRSKSKTSCLELPAQVESPLALWRFLASAAALIALASLLYLPSLNGGFILDDDIYLTNCSLIKASDGLYRYWFTTEPNDYWPLTNTTFWIEWRLWGMNPTGYHVTNLILHIASALLVWAILYKLAIPGAWLAALLFAVHPVNVESVAWISQRKNVLSMLFFLLSILWYLKVKPGAPGSSVQHPISRWIWYCLSLLAFTLAMLGKGSVAILPLVLLLLAWWQRGTISKWDLVRTAPFFLVAVALVAVNVWFQRHGSNVEVRDAGFVERLLGAGAVVWFYLYKALLPVNLVFIYPQWSIESADWRWWVPLVAGVVVTAVLLWQRNSPYGRPLLFAWLFFCVALAPVLGFTDVGFMKHSLVADRYQYISVIGVTALAAAVAATAAWRFKPRWLPRYAAPAIVLAVFCVLTFRQAQHYADAGTLYRNVLAHNDSWLAYGNLGVHLCANKRPEEAIALFRRALRLKPDEANLHSGLGAALIGVGSRDGFHPGQLEEAVQCMNEALRLEPDNADALVGLGNALTLTNHVEDAMSHYQRALERDAMNAKAQFGVGGVLSKAGKWSEAQACFEKAVNLDPAYADARHALGNALAMQNDYRGAVKQYEEAIRLDPDHFEALQNLGASLIELGQQDQAIAYLNRALKLRPDDAMAKDNLRKAVDAAAKTRPADVK